MPEPSDLVKVARFLVNEAPDVTDAHLRRAVFSAYYAAFHKVVRIAAERFMGAGLTSTSGHALIYRGFDHRHMRTVFDALQRSTLKDRYQAALRRTKVSQDLRDFAEAFVSLQAARHSADYDPAAEFLLSDVVSLINAAEAAIEAFDRVPGD